MSKIFMIHFNQNRTYDWLIFPKAYFNSALLSAQHFKAKKEIEEFNGIDGELDYLFFPIVFNMKHGIELYLKAIIGIKNGNYPGIHDLMELWKKTGIHDPILKKCISKYAFSRSLNPTDKNIIDKMNTSERYAQDNIYDHLPLQIEVDSSGSKTKCPNEIGLEAYINWMIEKGIKIESIVTSQKIQELIDDIDTLKTSLRDHARIACKHRKAQ